MNKLLKIYLTGMLILIGAVIINVLFRSLKMATRYDILQTGLYREISILEWIVLVFVYPLMLGYLSYVLVKKISNQN